MCVCILYIAHRHTEIQREDSSFEELKMSF